MSESHRRSGPAVAERARVLDLEARQAKLQAWLGTRLPQGQEVSITPLQRASAGFSNETYAFDLRWREEGHERELALIVRWPPMASPIFPEYDMSLQFRVMQCLEGSGVPVPAVYWCEEDPSVLGAPFYVMERVEGAIPSDLAPSYHGAGILWEATPEGRAQMWWRAVEAMAEIHSVDWQRLDLAFLSVPSGGTDPLDRQIALYERWLAWSTSEPAPVLRAGFEWVKQHRFEPRRSSLCWGDAKISNLIFRNGEVVAVLDWEMAHLGDPEADLAWFLILDQETCATYGVPRLAGLPGREETVRYYERRTGRKVENLLYHEVFAALGSAVIIVQVAQSAVEAGYEGFPPDFATSNSAVRRLVELLDQTGGL